ncbi:uncharacterized protein BDR25DRAFT_344850 [Lindgomyces ingoldianus]|uniref:Uncharacterized protein n=1 Tax=Lindgomyces ingoldianus TaxID=673940 RepID=A0ACB6QLQ3_9PLEO|nr:uncharacterized protein BDR25DRAFT_344850 [Lindgomyces ingoldianus]KAF2467455.1 hypothetical protein BDR25DRAFT_344850 [Lindgomyces ingoldianus]
MRDIIPAEESEDRKPFLSPMVLLQYAQGKKSGCVRFHGRDVDVPFPAGGGKVCAHCDHTKLILSSILAMLYSTSLKPGAVNCTLETNSTASSFSINYPMFLRRFLLSISGPVILRVMSMPTLRPFPMTLVSLAIASSWHGEEIFAGEEPRVQLNLEENLKKPQREMVAVKCEVLAGLKESAMLWTEESRGEGKAITKHLNPRTNHGENEACFGIPQHRVLTSHQSDGFGLCLDWHYKTSNGGPSIVLTTSIQMLTRRTAPLRLLSVLSLLPNAQRRPMSSLTLNKDIFNPALYQRIRDVWFEGHSVNTTIPKPEVMQRWWMAGPEQKMIFDGHCRDNFGQALEAIAPEKWPEPTAEPFVQEVHAAAERSPGDASAEAAWTALGIILLLDQMSRNIYRTNEGLVKIYTHYDKIAQSFLSTVLSTDGPIIRPDMHPMWRHNPSYRLWFYMPLMHSEKIEDHHKMDAILKDMVVDLVQANRPEAAEYLEKSKGAEKHHREILDKFGRYPHRNACLGREATEEEKKFLADIGNTFGVAQK